MEALLYYFLHLAGWLLALGVFGFIGRAVYAAVRTNMPRKGSADSTVYVPLIRSSAIYAVVCLVAWFFVGTLGAAFVNVPAGHKGVIFSTTQGVSGRILGEGIHGVTPIVENVKMFDIRQQKFETDSNAATKDQQTVETHISVFFEPQADKMNLIYQNLGEEYSEKVLLPNVNEVMKAVVAKSNALELLSERERVSHLIGDTLKVRLAPYNLTVMSVAIGNFKFSQQFNESIERKQVAEQDALKKNYELQAAKTEAEIVRTQAEGKARASVAEAKGQSESARIVAAAIAGNPNYMRLKELENREKVAQILAAGQNIVYLPSGTLLNIAGGQANPAK